MPAEYDSEDKLRTIHHFVPQSYLRRFARADKPTQIYTYEINREPYSPNIQSIAGQRDFYTHTDDSGNETAALENVFAEIDDKGAQVLQILDRTEDGFINLEEEQKADLYYYIAHLHTRNLQQRKYLAEAYGQMSLAQMQFIASEKEAFHQMAKEAHGDNYTYDMGESARQSLINGDLKVNFDPMSEHFLGATLDNAQHLYLILMKLKRAALVTITEGSLRFVTSDNPVTHYLENEDPRRVMGVGYVNAIFQLPISPTRCLLLIDSGYEIDEFDCNEDHVNHMNYYTYRYADRWIFSDEKSDTISQMFNTHRAKNPLSRVVSFMGEAPNED